MPEASLEVGRADAVSGEAASAAGLRPLCFVLMPFGIKRDPAGGPDIDFDRIYRLAIEPAIRAAELEPIRADHEVTAGVIHKAMFERLLLCEFAIADLTTANANVFYELGVRHAARPHSTLLIFAEKQPLPFDVNLLRALPYQLGANKVFGAQEAASLSAAICKRLTDLRNLTLAEDIADSPLVQLLTGYNCPNLAHLRTDVFRERVSYAQDWQRKLANARSLKPASAAETALLALEQELWPIDSTESAILVDLLLSYRAVKAFDRMLALYERLPEVLRRTVMVREQYAFALNRKAAQVATPELREQLRSRATQELEQVLAERGPNAETCSLLGRVYKDRWDEARRTDPARARGLLRSAIKEYTRGFEADSRDALPGINAVTLLDIAGDAASKTARDRLLPVVRFAVDQRVQRDEQRYWEYATLLELCVIGSLREEAENHLADALAAAEQAWWPETTARNLRLLCEARSARGEDVAWIAEAVAALEKTAQRLQQGQ